MSSIVSIGLTGEIEQGLARIAATRGISLDAVAAEAVERFVIDELSEIAGIEMALLEMREGKVVSHDDVTADVDTVLRGEPAPAR